MRTEKTKIFNGKINGVEFSDEDEYEKVESIIMEIERKTEKEINGSEFVETVRNFFRTFQDRYSPTEMMEDIEYCISVSRTIKKVDLSGGCLDYIRKMDREKLKQFENEIRKLG
jgi:hypothetical protein